MKILIIEDEEEIAASIARTLKSHFFIVDISSTGSEGSYLARTYDYDLIILDLNLPEKNGLEICKEIREDKKETPILIVSVLTEVTKKVDLLDAGADDYLTKPFSLGELIARAKALLRRPRQIKSDRISIGDLVLENKKHLVQRGGKEIHLTRKEFMLLEYLMHNRGIVLSRSMIMEHVWDMTVDPFSNTIESHIMSLRKKIDYRNKIKLIHTISGKGYTIDLR